MNGNAGSRFIISWQWQFAVGAMGSRFNVQSLDRRLRGVEIGVS